MLAVYVGSSRSKRAISCAILYSVLYQANAELPTATKCISFCGLVLYRGVYFPVVWLYMNKFNYTFLTIKALVSIR